MNEYDVVYPAKGRARLDGGLNTKFERSIIPDNESYAESLPLPR